MIRRGALMLGMVLLTDLVLAQVESYNPEPSHPDYETCLRSLLADAPDDTVVGDLKRHCAHLLDKNPEVFDEERVSGKHPNEEALFPPVEEANGTDTRLAIERLNRTNRFLLIPHRRNYILPLSYKKEPNETPYVGNNSALTDLKHGETEFQFSIKVLIAEGVLSDGYLYFGYTNQTFWQFYNLEKSTPFRETNQQPEIMLRFYSDWEILGFHNVMNEVVLNHQSNGQGGELSRSWNRMMLNSMFQKGNLVFALTPWYRLPEDEKDTPDDALGDDNPDIEKYMGHFEFSGMYKYNRNLYSVVLRNNLREDNKGAVELSWSFPLYKRSYSLRGYIKYFNGYGHSLIDYNDYTQAVGFGVVFSDLF